MKCNVCNKECCDCGKIQIRIGDYAVDLFLTSFGNLGITVEKTDSCETVVECLDVFILPNLDPTEVLVS